VGEIARVANVTTADVNFILYIEWSLEEWLVNSVSISLSNKTYNGMNFYSEYLNLSSTRKIIHNTCLLACT
jgi:hypothetical protein